MHRPFTGYPARLAKLDRDRAAGADTTTTPAEPEDDAATEDTDLRARLSPWSETEDDAGTLQITVYIVTGYHGKLRVPESFCRECHMFTRRAQQAIDEVETEVSLSVRSWWTHVPWALRHGGYHPPVMVVGGNRLCQGHDVPTTDDVVEAIEQAETQSGRGD
jgi:hypothetical protein